MPRFSGSQAAMGVRKPIGRSKISNGSVLLPGVDGRNEIARKQRGYENHFPRCPHDVLSHHW